MALTFFGSKKSGGGGTLGGPTDGGEAAMRAMLEEVRAYWQGLRVGDALPLRDQIDPRGLRGALHGAFLIERIAPGIGRLRIAGMNFTDLLGMDGRGMPLSTLFDPMSRARLGNLLDACFLRPAVLEMVLGSESGLGRPGLSARLLLMPINSLDGRGEMALGCLALSGQIGRQPRRMTIESASCTPVTLPRLTAVQPMRDLTRLAEAPAPLPPALVPSLDAQDYTVKPSTKARSYLKLVDLGR